MTTKTEQTIAKLARVKLNAGEAFDLIYWLLEGPCRQTPETIAQIRNVLLMAAVKMDVDDMHWTLTQEETAELMAELKKSGVKVRIVESLPPEAE